MKYGKDIEVNKAPERHTKDFTQKLKDIVTKEYLEKICKRPDSVAIVWKQWFPKQEGEFVAEMVLVEQQDGRYLVDHEMVF